jgi:hypothetical protein
VKLTLVDVERHRVGGVSLQLQRMRASRRGRIDQRQSAIEGLVVIA